MLQILIKFQKMPSTIRADSLLEEHSYFEWNLFKTITFSNFLYEKVLENSWIVIQT